jgi:hypothetical protein
VIQNGGDVITYSGVHIQKIGGAAGTPTAQDIAVQSGRICRYGGAIWMPLITHSVLVGLLAYRRNGGPADLLWGLVHDSSEIASGEIPRNFKCSCIKREQAALDERIIDRFIGQDLAPSIDRTLVKQCDIDALDLEAVALGLPNYESIAPGVHGRPIHRDSQDQRLMRDLIISPFYVSTLSPYSRGVVMFQQALELAEQRRTDEFLEAVLRWGLL